MNILKFTFFYFNIVQELSGWNNWEQSGKLRTIGNLLKQFRPNSTGGMQVERIGEKDFTQWYEKLKLLVIVLILIGRKEITKVFFLWVGFTCEKQTWVLPTYASMWFFFFFLGVWMHMYVICQLNGHICDKNHSFTIVRW